MGQYNCHVFVCTSGETCPQQGDVEKYVKILRTAADIHARFGVAALPNYVISKCQSASDLLEVAVLLKEVGLVRGEALALNVIPLFETIDDLARCGDIMRAAFADAANGRRSCSAIRTATRTAGI